MFFKLPLKLKEKKYKFNLKINAMFHILLVSKISVNNNKYLYTQIKTRKLCIILNIYPGVL